MDLTYVFLLQFFYFFKWGSYAPLSPRQAYFISTAVLRRALLHRCRWQSPCSSELFARIESRNFV